MTAEPRIVSEGRLPSRLRMLLCSRVFLVLVLIGLAACSGLAITFPPVKEGTEAHIHLPAVLANRTRVYDMGPYRRKIDPHGGSGLENMKIAVHDINYLRWGAEALLPMFLGLAFFLGSNSARRDEKG